MYVRIFNEKNVLRMKDLSVGDVCIMLTGSYIGEIVKIVLPIGGKVGAFSLSSPHYWVNIASINDHVELLKPGTLLEVVV